MIDERINNTLKELEQELRNIDSARKQVEKTVNSFDSLNSTTVEYVTNLGKITKNIQELVDGIGQDYKQRIEDFENDRNTIINNTKIAIEQLSNSTESFKNSLLGLKKKLQYSLIFSIVTIIAVCVLIFFR